MIMVCRLFGHFVLPIEHLQIPGAQQQAPRQMMPMNAQPQMMRPLNATPMNAQPMNYQHMNAQPMNAQSMSFQPMNAQPMSAQPMNVRCDHICPAQFLGAALSACTRSTGKGSIFFLSLLELLFTLIQEAPGAADALADLLRDLDAM